jgi:hypothetical protein
VLTFLLFGRVTKKRIGLENANEAKKMKGFSFSLRLLCVQN